MRLQPLLDVARAGGDSGGTLAVVEREGPMGVARLYVRTGAGATSRRELFDASPDMLAGLDKRPTFQF